MSFGLSVQPTKWLWDFCESRIGAFAALLLLATACVLIILPLVLTALAVVLLVGVVEALYNSVVTYRRLSTGAAKTPQKTK